MIMKNYARFEEELTSQFKIDMKNLANFDLSTQTFQKLAQINQMQCEIFISSGKWSDPLHFLKSQGKSFLSFPCTRFNIFLTQVFKSSLKSSLGCSIYHYYHIRNI